MIINGRIAETARTLPHRQTHELTISLLVLPKRYPQYVFLLTLPKVSGGVYFYPNKAILTPYLGF